MAGRIRKAESGFVVGGDPRAELAKLRSILSSSATNRAARLAQHIDESKKRARELADRDVAADLES